MNTKKLLCIGAVLCGLVFVSHTSRAQGTAFTYQGQLETNGVALSGTYDFNFALFNAATAGTRVGSIITNLGVTVNNGLFMVTNDFGAVFDGTTLWMRIEVRTNGGTTFTTLNPRQELTPTPYAIFAEGADAAGLSGTIPLGGVYSNSVSFTNIGNSFAGNGSGLSNVNATLLDGLSPTNFWSITGNAGMNPAAGYFLGTTDTNTLQLQVNGMAAMRLIPKPNLSNASNIVDVLGGSPANYISPSIYGGTIAGGGGTIYIANTSISNVVSADFGTVGGGEANTASGPAGTVAGGFGNTAGGALSGPTVGGGGYNVASGAYATVAGGYTNSAGGWYASTGGGQNNAASGFYSTVPGGYGNAASGQYSLAAGQKAQAATDGTFVWADDSSSAPFTSTANNQFLIRSSYVGINRNGTINGNDFFDVRAPVTNAYGGMNVETAGTGLPFYGYAQNGAITAYHFVDGTDADKWKLFNEGTELTATTDGKFGINTTSPQQALDVNGEFMVVDGLGGVLCYIGDDGHGNDVQVGSLKSGATNVAFYNATDNSYMHIICSSITVNGGADLAEPFSISGAESEVPQGAVVVIDAGHPGHLKLSAQAYDTRVAGVVSGANGINPGIQLRQSELVEGGRNVALSGRVYVLAEALHAAIEPGDLLTTSDVPGHAMKVGDHARAQGAILGKAMTGLPQGKGMVLVLVSLQ